MSSTAEEEAHLMGGEDQSLDDDYNPRRKSGEHRKRRLRLALIYGGIVFLSILLMSSIFASLHSHSTTSPRYSCLDSHDGYTCQPTVSHKWGQYSSYYLVPSNINAKPPPGCHVSMAQLLSRHGARDPTLHKSTAYAGTISKIKSRVPPSSISSNYSFLTSYTYNLGFDQLTSFGRQQMFESGLDFFSKYSSLVSDSTLFIRASGQTRVVESASRFAEGFNHALITADNGNMSSSRSSRKDPYPYPYPILIIPETTGQNNTLSHGQCPAFETSTQGRLAQATFSQTFLPTIRDRLNADLPGAELTLEDALFMMDLCPFETVASAQGHISPFCDLFTEDEWVSYDYYQTLGKYYGYGAGSPLGPTQGVGFVNELIARLTGTPVNDSTTTNRTLDADESSFPLDRKLYADFSHDNDMISIFAALGLYSSTPVLKKQRVMSEDEMGGFGAGRTVPFAGRAVMEKLICEGKGDVVRVVMNGRVLPLEMCGGDGEGLCTLQAFVEGLAFAREGGRWEECFVDADEDEDGRAGEQFVATVEKITTL